MKKNEDVKMPEVDLSKLDPETLKFFAQNDKEAHAKRKELLAKLFDYDLGNIEQYASPLTRGEKKKHKTLLETAKKNDASDDDLEEFAVAILLERGLSEDEADKLENGTLAVFAERLLVSPADLEYVTKKK